MNISVSGVGFCDAAATYLDPHGVPSGMTGTEYSRSSVTLSTLVSFSRFQRDLNPSQSECLVEHNGSLLRSRPGVGLSVFLNFSIYSIGFMWDKI